MTRPKSLFLKVILIALGVISLSLDVAAGGNPWLEGRRSSRFFEGEDSRGSAEKRFEWPTAWVQPSSLTVSHGGDGGNDGSAAAFITTLRERGEDSYDAASIYDGRLSGEAAIYHITQHKPASRKRLSRDVWSYRVVSTQLPSRQNDRYEYELPPENPTPHWGRCILGYSCAVSGNRRSHQEKEKGVRVDLPRSLVRALQLSLPAEGEETLYMGQPMQRSLSLLPWGIAFMAPSHSSGRQEDGLLSS